MEVTNPSKEPTNEEMETSIHPSSMNQINAFCASNPIPARWILSIIGLFGGALIFSFSINMSMAIVCMVNNTKAQGENNFNNTNYALHQENCSILQKTQNTYDGEFNWDNIIQGHVLSAFFYGFVATQTPGGWLADRYGGKHIFGIGMMISIAATMLTPVSARISVYLLIAARVVTGLGVGVGFPCLSSLLGTWAPPLDRSRLLSLCHAGPMLGNVVGLSLSGFLCASGIDGGWPLVFYVFGCLGCVWYLFWLLFVYNSPSDHPCMKDTERDYIISSIGPQLNKSHSTPWLHILKSTPFWALLITHICSLWGTFTLSTCLPTYMAQVLKFDIKANGLLSALPYIIQLVCAITYGHLVDWLLHKRIMSTTALRRLVQCISFVGQAIFLTATGFLSCQQRTLAVAFLCISGVFTAAGRVGYAINHVDLSPRYAGILLGITATMATITGIVAPIIASYLTPNGTKDEWRTVFYISGGVWLFGALVYGIFGSGEEQDWTTSVNGNENGPTTKKEFKLATKQAAKKNAVTTASTNQAFEENGEPTVPESNNKK